MSACATFEQEYRTSVPTFVYWCLDCGVFLEVQQHYDEDALTTSPCGGACRRTVAPVQWSPQATPNRKSSAPPRTPDNSWERGELTDHRNMPVLGGDLEPLTVKDLANDRGRIEGGLRRLRNDPHVFESAT